MKDVLKEKGVQLPYVCNQSRPGICIGVSNIASNIINATIKQLTVCYYHVTYSFQRVNPHSIVA